MIKKTLLLCLVTIMYTGCASVKNLHTDSVYHYANGFVTDKDNKVVYHYANGFVTKQLNISKDKPIKINEDLEIFRLAPNCFLYTAWADMGQWGRVGSNGLVIVRDGKAFLIDSPSNESQMVELAWWFDKNIDVKFVSFAPGHWHDDCVGGMAWLNRNGVKTYANRLTNQLLASKGLEQAKESFSDSLKLSVGNTDIELYYLGGGHSTDNIVAWIPSQKILFGGCMIKDMNAESIGNISDAAPLDEWLQTIKRIDEKFDDVKYIIPGHGKYGGKELLKHTKEIIEKELKKKSENQQ